MLWIPVTGIAQEYSINVIADSLNNEQKDALVNNLSLERQRNSPYLSLDYVESLYNKGINELQDALRVFGFYKAEITSTFNNDEEPWEITYHINAGPQLKIRNLDIQITGKGASSAQLVEWRKNIPLSAGEPLNQQHYEQSKNTVRQIMLELGYFDGRLTKHELRISLVEYYADVVLNVETGERYRFGEAQFNHDKFNEKYMKGFLPFQSGDEFDAEKLTSLQKQLSQSGEFQTIEIVPQVEKAEDLRVPVLINVTARKPLRYSVGIGYGTDTGPRTRFGVQRRQITDTGHRADTQIFYSQIRTEFTANYYIPLSKPGTDFFNINFDRQIEDTDDLFRETNSVSVSTAYDLKNWQRTVKLTYLDETFEIGDENETSQLLIPSIAFRWLAPNPGELNISQWRLFTELKGAHEDALSDTSFAQARLKINNRWPALPKIAVLTRIDVGWSGIEDFSLLPVSQRFFAGGDNSVRGFAYNSIGPENDSGEVVGGSRLLVGSIELQYALDAQWDVAVFSDAGNAFDEDVFEPEQGAGIGFGYALPVGSIRAYGATALSKGGNPWRLHLTVGAQW